MAIEILSATTLNEVEAAAKLYPEYSRTSDYVGSPQYEYDHVARGNGVILYAKTGNEVVGVIQLLVKTAPPAKLMEEDAALMQRLRVHPDSHRQGIGTLLCQAVERVAVDYGFRAITMVVEPDNQWALALYVKLGYCQTADYVSKSTGRRMLALRKDLKS